MATIFKDLNEIDMAIQLKDWLMSNDWNEKLEYPLKEYGTDEMDHILKTWTSKIDLMREVINAATLEMHLQLNDARSAILEAKDDE